MVPPLLPSQHRTLAGLITFPRVVSSAGGSPSPWHLRAGPDLFVRPFSPLFLTGRQLLNTTNASTLPSQYLWSGSHSLNIINPSPLCPPNISGQEVTVMPNGCLHVFLPSAACSVAVDGNKTPV